MTEFLTGKPLSTKIREVLSGANRRCAVAFWGHRASELLRKCSKENSRDAKIVCDLSMGGTYPPELTTLGAPNNEKLRFLNGLHAKVYISNTGAIVASANVSSNGIGFADDGEPDHLEAGTFYPKNDHAWEKIARWFDEIYQRAKPVDEEALAIARARWTPPKGASMPNYNVRPNSLLDMVRNNPEKFNGVGFVFSGERIAEEDAEQARQVFGKNHLQAEAQHAINKWPSGDMFVGWGDEETRNWPGRFFEFWMPKKRLQVLAREVAYRDQDAQAVFVRRAWQGIKGQVGLELPTLASIERSDAEIAAKIISDDGYAFFANANDLWKRLIEIGDK